MYIVKVMGVIVVLVRVIICGLLLFRVNKVLELSSEENGIGTCFGLDLVLMGVKMNLSLTIKTSHWYLFGVSSKRGYVTDIAS